MTCTQSQYASQFRALHGKDCLLILPNAWDAASARVAEECGALAVATSSAAVAWAHGHPDGEAMSSRVLLETVKEITRIVRVPVSVDSEAGYSSDPRGGRRFRRPVDRCWLRRRDERRRQHGISRIARAQNRSDPQTCVGARHGLLRQCALRCLSQEADSTGGRARRNARRAERAIEMQASGWPVCAGASRP